jgi:hypothetical protein
MSIFFSQGSAHERPPSVSDVLECLASDSTALTSSFEEWAADCGYDLDSRKAYRIYAVCVIQAENLKSLLGPEAFADFA